MSNDDRNLNVHVQFNERIENNPIVTDDFVTNKFTQAFGADLIRSDGSSLDVDGEIRSFYLEMVKLRGKQYQLPDGPVGRKFCDILASEIERYNQGLQKSEREFLFTALILQKKKSIKSGKEVRALLKRRMDLWEKGSIKELLDEAKRCDRQYPNMTDKMDEDHLQRVFNRLMMLGKVREANYLITERAARGGVLHPHDIAEGKDGPLNKTVLEVFIEKHPDPRPLDKEAFMECDDLPILVDIDVNANTVEKIARMLKGSGGPSKTDSDQWRNILLRYGAHSLRVREAVAASIRRHANEIVEWDHIRAFLSRRGIALDKSPGTRPIGISEMRQRIEAKAMMMETGIDLQEVAGADNLGVGIKAGIEGGAHAMRDSWESDDSDGVLLVDAGNAFNSLYREATLWNARILWPRCSRYLFNTYRGYAQIFMRGSDEIILSKEGTTQGDPLGMAMYGVGILPLVRKLKKPAVRTQNWYVDDSGVSAKLRRMREWFDELCDFGPSYGYYPEPTKCVLVVKKGLESEAKEIFEGTGVKIVSGGKYLGGCVGDQKFVEEFVFQKVEKWVTCVENLSKAAFKYPQSVYSCFTKSFQSECIYLQRVVPNYDGLYHSEYYGTFPFIIRRPLFLYYMCKSNKK